MKTVTRCEVLEADPQTLGIIRHNLIVERMKLDKFFSVFLDSVEMDDQDTSTMEWITYREMLKEYSRVEHLIKTTDNRIRHYV